LGLYACLGRRPQADQPEDLAPVRGQYHAGEAGLDPGPKRGEKTWDEFIKIHGATLWQCDFLTKKSWTLKGLRVLYVLVFQNVGTHRIYVAPATAHPNQEWVVEQAKAFVEHARREKLPAELVFHDADSKFGAAFDDALTDMAYSRAGSNRGLPI
jgi:hypothetical protein